MEVGGYQSHGAIVSREYGLPAAANIPGLFDLLHDGDEVLVDGDAGTVTIMSRTTPSQREGGAQAQTGVAFSTFTRLDHGRTAPISTHPLPPRQELAKT